MDLLIFLTLHLFHEYPMSKQTDEINHLSLSYLWIFVRLHAGRSAGWSVHNTLFVSDFCSTTSFQQKQLGAVYPTALKLVIHQ